LIPARMLLSQSYRLSNADRDGNGRGSVAGDGHYSQYLRMSGSWESSGIVKYLGKMVQIGKGVLIHSYISMLFNHCVSLGPGFYFILIIPIILCSVYIVLAILVSP
jgi:hypothetical protein